MNKKKLIVIVVLSLMLLIIPLTTSLSFLLNPIINSGGTTYTTDDLNCVWSYSGDTINQTINWYKDGVLNKTIFENSSLSTNNTLSSSNTIKNQDWICEVILKNSSSTYSKNATTTIENIAPITPKLFNGSTQLTGVIQVTEDQNYNFLVNSTDPDGDTLTYYAEPSEASNYFCTITNSATGAMTCTPTQSDLVNNNYTEENMTFWASDFPSNPGNAKAASNKFTFNITPVNDPPIATLSNQTTDLDESFSHDFSVNDEESDTIIATLDSTNTDPEIVGDVTVNMNGASLIQVNYSTSPLDFDDVGNRTISINISDDKGAWHLQTFVLTINTINRPPNFTNFTPSSPYNIAQGDNLIINVSMNDIDLADGFKSTETITLITNYSAIIVTLINTTATNSSDALAQLNFTATPGSVGVHTVQLTANDQTDTNTTTIVINVSNINDPPIIYNYSYYSENTLNNFNNSNLTAYTNSPFIYRINWTDYDSFLGDSVNFTTNSSLFNITNNGLIDFTPNNTGLGNHSVLITVDDGEAQDTAILLLEIKNNSNPYFSNSFPEPVNCSEKNICYFNVANYSIDDDANDNVSAYSYQITSRTNNNSLNINLNSSSGNFNFTPTQDNVGNYSLNFTIYDNYGASNSQIMNLTIQNINDLPVWERYNFSSETIVENKAFQYNLRVSDQDLLLSGYGEYLNLSTNVSYITIQSVSTINDTLSAILSFVPNSTLVGNQEILLIAHDKVNASTNVSVSFTVLPETLPPNITSFKPYGDISNGTYFINSFKNTSGYSQNIEAIKILENTSNVSFEIGVTDDYTAFGDLVFTWYYDGTEINSGTNTTNKSFNFYSSGIHDLVVVVNDTTLESSNWTWRIDVENVNQLPLLVNDLYNNISVDQTTAYPGYFRQFAGDNDISEIKFYDPDDDLDEDGLIDNGETQTITYTHTSCVAANLSISNDDLTIIPLSVGDCQVIFTATDSEGASVNSGTVNITVLSVPKGSSTTSTTSSGGGGGGTSTIPQMIPISNNVEVPKPLQLIAPEVATTYENRTIKIPVKVTNNWKEVIKGIKLSAIVPKNSNMTYSFDSDFIEQLDVNTSTNISLSVSGYRLGDNFELKIIANATEPSFNDDALVLFNSIEKGSDEKQMEAKVTFAQDLLSEHSECQELAEMLQKGNELLQKGNIKEAAKYVDVAINGCKYLISKVQPNKEKPGLFNDLSFELNENTLRFLGFTSLIIIIIIGLAIIIVYHYKDHEEYDF